MIVPVKRIAFALIAGAAMASTMAGAAPRNRMMLLISDIDSSFVCPDTITEPEARKATLDNFAHRLAANGVTYAQARNVLKAMLIRHRCGATLTQAPAELAAVDEAPSPELAATATPAAPLRLATSTTPR